MKYTNNEAYFDVIEEIDAIIDKSGNCIGKGLIFNTVIKVFFHLKINIFCVNHIEKILKGSLGLNNGKYYNECSESARFPSAGVNLMD